MPDYSPKNSRRREKHRSATLPNTSPIARAEPGPGTEAHPLSSPCSPPRAFLKGDRRGSNLRPFSKATIRCEPLQSVLTRPETCLIYGVLGHSGGYLCPLRTSLYQYGCSTSPSETNTQRDAHTNDQPDDGYILPRVAGHAGRSGQRDGEPAVLASWTLTTSSTTCSRAVTSTSSRSWLGQRAYGAS
jgi:hypothetical protein